MTNEPSWRSARPPTRRSTRRSTGGSATSRTTSAPQSCVYVCVKPRDPEERLLQPRGISFSHPIAGLDSDSAASLADIRYMCPSRVTPCHIETALNFIVSPSFLGCVGDFGSLAHRQAHLQLELGGVLANQMQHESAMSARSLRQLRLGLTLGALADLLDCPPDSSSAWCQTQAGKTARLALGQLVRKRRAIEQRIRESQMDESLAPIRKRPEETGTRALPAALQARGGSRQRTRLTSSV